MERSDRASSKGYIVRGVEDNICTYRNGEILHASAVLLKLFMLDREYISTGENLHFLFRVVNEKYVRHHFIEGFEKYNTGTVVYL